MTEKKPFVVAVVGPTASGKTALGIKIAREFGGEVVSCDSMQIYKRLDIGTAKASEAERQAAPHHMIDIAEPWEKYSVGRFCEEASDVIDDILSRGRLPVLVGGTGLYIDNLVAGTHFSAPKRSEKLSAELYEFAKKHGAPALYELLQKEDPTAAATVHPNDVKRVARAIETVRITGKTRRELNAESISEPRYDCLWLEPSVKREELYKRIDSRVDDMLACGLLDETRRELYPIKKSGGTALGAIGYREMLWYLSGLCTYSEAVRLLKRNTRRYAKRQMTWFGRNNKIHRLSGENIFSDAAHLIEKKGF